MSGRKRIRRPNFALKEKIKKAIINLITTENVTEFFVGHIGGFEEDAYDSVLEVKKNYPNIIITLIISKMSEFHYTNIKNSTLKNSDKYCDNFILPEKCATGYKKLSIVYRNRYIIEHADFIISYNKFKGNAYKFCQQAKVKGVKIIELVN